MFGSEVISPDGKVILGMNVWDEQGCRDEASGLPGLFPYWYLPGEDLC